MSEPNASTAVISNDDRATIRALEDRLADAYLRGDIGVLDNLLADDYLVTDGPGTTSTKAKVLDDHRSRDLQVTLFQFEDVTVRLFGETALVQGQYSWDASYKGRPIAGSFRYMRVYVRGGKTVWRIVAGQVTPILTKKP